MKQRTAYIKTFGCQMNERDSEIIEQLLSTSGFIPSPDVDNADLIFINTCSIRAKAEHKVYSLLGQLRQYKLRNPKVLIGVAGCVAQQEGEKIFQRMPHVDMVIGTQQIYQIPELIQQLDAGVDRLKPAVRIESSFNIPPFQKQSDFSPSSFPSPSAFKKFVTIMQGCNNYCSYCVVPYTRGNEVSRPVEDILAEIRYMVTKGIYEITLLGQNVNSYGKTNPVADIPVHFAGLLRQVADIPGIKRLRFTTSNPKDLTDELMRCFSEIDTLCPQFHLPVQSGSDHILKLMNRKYTIADYLNKVETLRKYQPAIALSTDIIIGFPGETEEDFEQTMTLLNSVRYHSSFSFKYSDRPGTRSASFSNKVDEEVKSARLACFQSRQDEISLERNREYLKSIVDVIVEGTGKNNLLFGRTPTNHIVHFPPVEETPLKAGDGIKVRITKAGQHSLTGKASGDNDTP